MGPLLLMALVATEEPLARAVAPQSSASTAPCDIGAALRDALAKRLIPTNPEAPLHAALDLEPSGWHLTLSRHGQIEPPQLALERALPRELDCAKAADTAALVIERYLVEIEWAGDRPPLDLPAPVMEPQREPTRSFGVGAGGLVALTERAVLRLGVGLFTTFQPARWSIVRLYATALAPSSHRVRLEDPLTGTRTLGTLRATTALSGLAAGLCPRAELPACIEATVGLQTTRLTVEGPLVYRDTRRLKNVPAFGLEVSFSPKLTPASGFRLSLGASWAPSRSEATVEGLAAPIYRSASLLWGLSAAMFTEVF